MGRDPWLQLVHLMAYRSNCIRRQTKSVVAISGPCFGVHSSGAASALGQGARYHSHVVKRNAFRGLLAQALCMSLGTLRSASHDLRRPQARIGQGTCPESSSWPARHGCLLQASDRMLGVSSTSANVNTSMSGSRQEWEPTTAATVDGATSGCSPKWGWHHDKSWSSCS